VLLKDLSKIAKRSSDNPEDWVPAAPKMNISRSDKNELADRFEEYGERRSEEFELELRLNNVERALERINKGIYGVCKVGGRQIERERLEANPAADTCLNHLGK